jgi:CMP-N,N'-diacetyllegionaminic acid synthase
MRVSAIILARGGSKGVPGKNIISFCGKPLLAWTIKHCMDAEGVDDVWVSSNDEKILDVAHEYGARTILRPKNISGDHAVSESGWLHALEQIEHLTAPVDLVVAPQVTSPLREPQDISSALQDIKIKKLDSLFTVVEVEDFFTWKLNNQGCPESVNYDHHNRKLRQFIEKRFLENGSFYIFSPRILRKYKNRMGEKIGFKVMEKHKMFQIDTIEDIRLCEVIMQGYHLNSL